MTPFARQGYDVVPEVVSAAECRAIDTELQRIALEGAGTRKLLADGWCARLAQQLRAHPAIAPLLPATHVAVQCTYFEKSRGRNWLVPLHQDLSIPVARRVAHAGLTGWSEKEGALYVQPPLGVLQDLVAVRLHIDPCGPDDGPLKVVPGTHTLGIIPAEAGPAMRASRHQALCLAGPGAAVLMHPLLLHASSKATGQSLRRVLHFLFGPAQLPHGLQWQQT